MSDWRFSFTDQVRYGDLDTNAHLNNVAYHQFFESARVAYMRGLFPDIDPMGRGGSGPSTASRDYLTAGSFGMIFAETHVRFASPAFYEEILRVDVKPVELRRSSVKIAFRMVCEADERLVAEGWGTLVGYDYVAGRAAPLPEHVAAKLREEA